MYSLVKRIERKTFLLNDHFFSFSSLSFLRRHESQNSPENNILLLGIGYVTEPPPLELPRTHTRAPSRKGFTSFSLNSPFSGGKKQQSPCQNTIRTAPKISKHHVAIVVDFTVVAVLVVVVVIFVSNDTLALLSLSSSINGERSSSTASTARADGQDSSQQEKIENSSKAVTRHPR